MPRTSTLERKKGVPSPSIARQRVEETKKQLFKRPKRGADVGLSPVDKGARKYHDTCTNAAAAQVSPDKPLTVQQQAFVENWAAGDSIVNATLRAGYESESIGYRMVHMPNIKRAYEREKALYEEASQMTRKKVMDMHLEAFQMAKLMAEPASMVSAAREIGRMCGYYEPVKHQIDVNVKGEVTVRQLNSMSDAELLKFISGATPLQLTEDRPDEPA